MKNFKVGGCAAKIAALLIMLLSTLTLAATNASAQFATPLYSFTGSTGNQPSAGLIEDASGNFYGTAWEGGDNLTLCGGVGCGVVFELVNSSGSYTEKVLYSFTGGTDGAEPLAGLILDKAGNLYGTTQIGGTTCSVGCGVVFKLAPPVAPDTTWTETVLYSFTGSDDGVAPVAGLIMDASGNLYGTTSEGGVSPNHYGTVFELVNSSGSYTEKVLYSFTGGNDGVAPNAGLIMDASGNLYGTTSYGGGSTACAVGCGTVFELTPPVAPATTWSETQLYAFTGSSDGAQPQGGVVMDASGNLYGTTAVGGDTSLCGGAQGPGSTGCGVVFKVTPSSKTETALYAFTYNGGPGDGAVPFAGLIIDTSGNLFGTTSGGGASDSGTVFEAVNSSGTYTEKILYSFTGGNDGAQPIAGVIADKSGNLFGTAKLGGADGDGTAFAIAPVTLSATQLNFGTVRTGTASAPQSVTITNIGSGTLTYTAKLSGNNPADFAIVQSCNSIAAGAMCSESLVFTPSTATTETALLTLTEAGLTQTVSLSGTGTATAFSITPKPTSTSVKPGAVAKFTIELKSQSGFSGPVTLSCSGAPSGCANLPQTVQLNGTLRVSSGVMIPQNAARGNNFTITFTGKSGAIDESATATVTAK